jgi:hypothetical protein
MNDTPPTDDQGDDLEKLYLRSSAHLPSRPGAQTRQAILDHSARLARIHSPTRSSGPHWRRPVLFGSLAAAALAGLLVGPQFLRPSTPPVAQPTGSAESAAVQTSEPAPKAMNLPAMVPAPNVPARAMQVAPKAAVAAAANPNQVASAGLPETSARMAVSSMHARQAPDAPSTAAAAQTSSAAAVGASSAAEALAEAAAPIDARDSNGRTALMWAVLQGRLDTVAALLQRGADPNAADAAGVTPLQAARAQHQSEIIDALLRAGAH